MNGRCAELGYDAGLLVCVTAHRLVGNVGSRRGKHRVAGGSSRLHAATRVVTSTAMALMSKLVLASAVASTAAFAPSSSARASTALAARQPIIAGNW